MTGADGGAGPGARPGWRWDVALSFAGAQRDYVERVAQALQARGVRCFYDADEEIELWGKYLAEELPRIYGEQAAAAVVFVSAEYAARDWTRLERRSALNRAVRERREYVLPARFDDTPLPGLLSDMVAIDLRTRTPQQFAAMIADKLARLAITASAPSADARDLTKGSQPAGSGTKRVTTPIPQQDPRRRLWVIATAIVVGAAALAAGIVAIVINSPSKHHVTLGPKPSLSLPRGCPSEHGPGYEEPIPLEGLSVTTLTLCSVNVNNGVPMQASPIFLSGFVRGNPPAGERLFIVTYADPTTCDTSGLPGSGLYYFQTEIDPSANQGYWQYMTNGSYPGSQTIRRYIYFAVAPMSEIRNLQRENPRRLPNDVTELAYLTIQGTIPSGHHCPASKQ